MMSDLRKSEGSKDEESNVCSEATLTAADPIDTDQSNEIDEKEVLLRSIKKHVKLLMEEYVNRKYVHEYSSNVIALCATIESCLLLGLKRRSLGLFKESSSVALLEKISKQNSSAKFILTIMSEERAHCCNSLSDTSYFSSNTNSSISSKSDGSNGSTFGYSWSTSSFLGLNGSKIFSSNNQSSENELSTLHQKNLKKHYWIRLALMEKVLDRIIDYLVKNSGRYYNRGSIIGDPCDGYILVSLLSGPCSLEYSTVKNPELIQEDPDAAELIQRQRIQNNCGCIGIEAGKSPKLNHVMSTSSLFWSTGSNQFLNRPVLVNRQRIPSSDNDDTNGNSCKSPFSTAKKYVESLHQSSNSTLLFGKNNVYSQPRDDMNKIPGYLSLHLTVNELLLKWTPNELMNGGMEESVCQERPGKIEWDCAMIIWVNKIVYIHCHRHVDKGDTMVLVNRDGSQIPPFDFPEGGHLMTFLNCLENGLLPKCRLDPPLWLHQSRDTPSPEIEDNEVATEGPKSADMISSNTNKKMVFLWSSADGNDQRFSWFHQPFNNKLAIGNRKILSEPIEQIVYHHTHKSPLRKKLDDFPTDLVFRIVRPKRFHSGESVSDICTDGGEDDLDEPFSQKMGKQIIPQWPYTYTVGAMKRRINVQKGNKISKSSIRHLCSSMKKEILARSFYGWLAYCRHMKTIRSHLNQLVLPPRSPSYTGEKSKLNAELWNKSFNKNKQVVDSIQILQQIYYGGCDPSIRVEVWPFLLGVYKWDSTATERDSCFHKWQKRYELAVSDWMIIETVIDEQMNDLSESVDQNEDSCVLEMEREYVLDEDNATAIFSTKSKLKKPKKQIITRRILNILKQNLNRIEKDVARCDRTFKFFDQTDKGEANLDILQRIMCTWVWENLELGYIQGMCDLLAPLVVIFQGKEELTFACFCKFMERMIENFPVKENSKMDLSFSRMRSAVQILDSDLLDHMQRYGDFTHFYFSYRWFLLDFKREFSYIDVFSLWETIWAADEVSSPNFSLFIGLSLLLSYRDIIMDNSMEFTDIIRFFNEMAEQHDTAKVLELARELVEKLQLLLHS